MRKVSAILFFYRSLAGALVTISLALVCVLYCNKPIAGSALYTALILVKISGDGAVWYFAKAIMARRLYYYYNLHISRSQLWLGTFCLDFLIFIVCLWMI